jgi:peptidoglycan-associated lipoprotein
MRMLSFCFILVVILSIVGCHKQVSVIQDSSNKADTSFHEINPFSNVDTSSGATFKEAVLSEELAKKVQEALQTIYFEYNSFQLNSDAIDKLQKIAEFLKENTGLRILVAGHCDERGSSEYNMGLGENRARVVKEYLLNIGVQPIRVETTSYGKEQPASANCRNDDCHSKNRRDEFRVLAR